MRKIPRWLVVVAAVVAVALVLRLVVFRPSPVPVEVARAEKGVVEDIVTNTRAGTVKARERAKLSPQVGGRVVSLPYRKGARVRAGDVLLEQDASVQRAQLSLAVESVGATRAKADEACLAAELAGRDWERGAALERDGITTAQSLDTLETNRQSTEAGCRAARATVLQAEAQVAVARAELALTRVRAPFDGVVADISTEVGEWITPSPPGVPIPPVLNLINAASIYVSAPIDEVDSERVEVGQEVRLSVDSRRGAHFAGRLSRVAPYVLDVEEQNRTVEVDADFADSAVAATILPGTSADVEIIVRRLEDVLRIPTAAIGEGGTVLVLAGGVLEERIVKTGLHNWQVTQVLSGVREGEEVVTLRDSTAIRAGARAVARERP